MSQEKVLESIKSNPGVLQRDLRKQLGFKGSNGSFSMSVMKLLKWGEIRREPHERTFKLYPAE